MCPLTTASCTRPFTVSCRATSRIRVTEGLTDGLKDVDFGPARPLWTCRGLPTCSLRRGRIPNPLAGGAVIPEHAARLQCFAPLAPSSGYCAGPARWVQMKSTATCYSYPRVHKSNKTSAGLLPARHSGSFSTAIPC